MFGCHYSRNLRHSGLKQSPYFLIPIFNDGFFEKCRVAFLAVLENLGLAVRTL